MSEAKLSERLKRELSGPDLKLAEDYIAELVAHVRALEQRAERAEAALVARHGGEPIALLAELDEARTRLAAEARLATKGGGQPAVSTAVPGAEESDARGLHMGWRESIPCLACREVWAEDERRQSLYAHPWCFEALCGSSGADLLERYHSAIRSLDRVTNQADLAEARAVKAEASCYAKDAARHDAEQRLAAAVTERDRLAERVKRLEHHVGCARSHAESWGTLGRPDARETILRISEELAAALAETERDGEGA